MTRRLALGFALLCCGGCITATPNPACVWTNEPALRLDLNTRAHQRHLNDDARVAEELAIRYADAMRGHRSGRYVGADEYHGVRDQCLAALSREIATRHQVQPRRVADAVGRRDERLDAAVLLVFTVLFAVAANGVARRLMERFPPDEPWPAMISAGAAAAFLSAAGVMIGQLGASIVEMVQLGDTHLSYRTSRIPWGRHWPLLFAGGIALFTVIAVVRWRQHLENRIHEI